MNEIAWNEGRLVQSLEALLQAADAPLPVSRLVWLLAPDHAADAARVEDALAVLAARYVDSAAEVVEVASGWRLQVRATHSALIARLWEARPPKLSRAVLETLARAQARQPGREKPREITSRLSQRPLAAARPPFQKDCARPKKTPARQRHAP